MRDRRNKPKDLLQEYQKIVDISSVPPTPDQYYIIRRIEYNLRIKFRGTTSLSAHEFIVEHANESRRVEKEREKR